MGQSFARRLTPRTDPCPAATRPDGTEGDRFPAEPGVPSIGVGPATIARAHEPEAPAAVFGRHRGETFLERLAVLHCTEPLR